MEYELGELLSYKQPTDYIVKSTDYDYSYNTPVLTAGKSFIIGYTNEETGIFSNLPVIIFDDFTTSSQYVDFPFKVKSSAMKILSCNNKIADLKYLFYKMQTIQFDSSNHKRYWISEYSKIKLELPTLAEQQRIVNRIESMFAKLDEAKEKAQNVVDGFEIRKAAILHKAFTGELTAKWRKENGVSDDSWEEKRFDEFCLLKRGFDLPATQRIEGMYPLVSSSGIIDTHNEAKVKAPGIVTGRSGSIGKVFYIEEDFFPLNTTLYSQNLFGNNARYVYYYLSNFDFKSFSSSTAVPTLNRNNFSKVELKVPTLPEQVEIVRILDIIIEKENKAKQAAEAVLEQIDLLKKSILARAFRGEL